VDSVIVSRGKARAEERLRRRCWEDPVLELVGDEEQGWNIINSKRLACTATAEKREGYALFDNPTTCVSGSKCRC
jgi:hypothetical protein